MQQCSSGIGAAHHQARPRADEEESANASRQGPCKIFRALLELATTRKTRRSKQKLQDTYVFVDVLCTETVTSRKTRHILLNKTEYIEWMKQNRSMSKEEAKLQWSLDKEDKNIKKEVENGVTVIAVKLPTLLEDEQREVHREYKKTGQQPQLKDGKMQLDDIAVIGVQGGQRSTAAPSQGKPSLAPLKD